VIIMLQLNTIFCWVYIFRILYSYFFVNFHVLSRGQLRRKAFEGAPALAHMLAGLIRISLVEMLWLRVILAYPLSINLQNVVWANPYRLFMG
jgi:hypothetical protein